MRISKLLLLSILLVVATCATSQANAPAFVLPSEEFLISVQPVAACSPTAVIAVGVYDLDGDLRPDVMALVLVTKDGQVRPLLMGFRTGEVVEFYAEMPGKGVQKLTEEEVQMLADDACNVFVPVGRSI